MKKIIAAAVAVALTAPVYAVEFGGEIEYKYVDPKTGDASLNPADVDFSVTHSVETDSGLTITASLSFESDTEKTWGSDGGKLAIAGAFGKLELGDAAGAVDSIDSRTSMAPAKDGSVVALGDDSAVAYTSPVVGGLTVRASMTPKDSVFAGEDKTSYSASYSLEGLTIAYGVDTEKDNDNETVTALSYTMGGATFAYTMSETEDGANTPKDGTSLAAKYALGDITLGFQQDKEETASTENSNNLYLFATYKLADEVALYIENDDNKTTPADDKTTLGIVYSF